jgi:hypothetical protein
MKKMSKEERRLNICLTAVFLAVNLLAVLFVCVGESAQIARVVAGRAQETGEMFGKTMENYEHSFQLFVEMMKHEIDNDGDPDHIWDFLKKLDPVLLDIEGDTFDGLYMYYKGRYLYSWDTPVSLN